MSSQEKSALRNSLQHSTALAISAATPAAVGGRARAHNRAGSLAIRGASPPGSCDRAQEHIRTGAPARGMLLALTLVAVGAAVASAQTAGVVERGTFRFAWDERGISGIAHARDPYGAVLVPVASRGGAAGGRGGAAGPAQPGAGTLGLGISYRTAGASGRRCSRARWSPDQPTSSDT